jgi:hypothetical protein
MYAMLACSEEENIVGTRPARTAAFFAVTFPNPFACSFIDAYEPCSVGRIEDNAISYIDTSLYRAIGVTSPSPNSSVSVETVKIARISNAQIIR